MRASRAACPRRSNLVTCVQIARARMAEFVGSIETLLKGRHGSRQGTHRRIAEPFLSPEVQCNAVPASVRRRNANGFFHPSCGRQFTEVSGLNLNAGSGGVS